MEKNLSILMACIFSLAIAQADLGEIVRKGDPGTENLCQDATIRQVCRMNHFQADAYCQSQNTRLPTVRELAFDVQQNHHAVGFREGWSSSRTYSVGTSETPECPPNGPSDYFYFDSTGYERPSGDLGSNFFWSSSFEYDHSNFGDYCWGWGWVLNGENGYLITSRGYSGQHEAYWDFNAVRCVRSP